MKIKLQIFTDFQTFTPLNITANRALRKRTNISLTHLKHEVRVREKTKPP